MAALVFLDLLSFEHEALSWMKFYFSDRIQHILIADCQSADSQLDFGFTQSSVLGQKIY